MDIVIQNGKYTQDIFNLLSDGGRNRVVLTGSQLYFPPNEWESDKNQYRGKPITKETFFNLFNKWVVQRINSLPKISRAYYVVQSHRPHLRSSGHPGLFDQLGNPEWNAQEFERMGICSNLYHIADDGNNNIDLADFINTIYPYVNAMSRLCMANITSNGVTSQFWAIAATEQSFDLWGLLQPHREMNLSIGNIQWLMIKIHDKIIENARNRIISYNYGDEIGIGEIQEGQWWPSLVSPNAYFDHFDNGRNNNWAGIFTRNVANLNVRRPNADNVRALWGGNMDLRKDPNRSNQWAAAVLQTGFSDDYKMPSHIWVGNSVYIDYYLPWVGRQFNVVTLRAPACRHIQYFNGYQIDHFNTNSNNRDCILDIFLEAIRNGSAIYQSNRHTLSDGRPTEFDLHFDLSNWVLQGGDTLRFMVHCRTENPSINAGLARAAAARNLEKGQVNGPNARYGYDLSFSGTFRLVNFSFR